MISEDELHRGVMSLKMTREHEMLLHALVRCGQVREIACAVEVCYAPSRHLFVVMGDDDYRRAAPWTPTIDHAIALFDNGSHLPENLRLAHSYCNKVRTRGKKQAPGHGDKIRAGKLRQSQARRDAINELLSNATTKSRKWLCECGIHTHKGPMMLHLRASGHVLDAKEDLDEFENRRHPRRKRRAILVTENGAP